MNQFEKVSLDTFLANTPSDGAEIIYTLERWNLFNQMNDVWGEANRAVTGGYSGDALVHQMASFSQMCLRIYSNPEISNAIKSELRHAEWELYDFCLWNNELKNDAATVMQWFDRWNDIDNYNL